jgi:hypothetical protein
MKVNLLLAGGGFYSEETCVACATLDIPDAFITGANLSAQQFNYFHEYYETFLLLVGDDTYCRRRFAVLSA